MLLANPRFRVLWRTVRVFLTLGWVVLELVWINGMRFEFGQANSLEQLVTAVFLQGFVQGVFFILLNQAMFRFCRWLALRIATFVWKRWEIKPPTLIEVPVAG